MSILFRPGGKCFPDENNEYLPEGYGWRRKIHPPRRKTKSEQLLNRDGILLHEGVRDGALAAGAGELWRIASSKHGILPAFDDLRYSTPSRSSLRPLTTIQQTRPPTTMRFLLREQQRLTERAPLPPRCRRAEPMAGKSRTPSDHEPRTRSDESRCTQGRGGDLRR